MAVVGDRFATAVAYAAAVHEGQVRKGSGTPYLGHLVGAASLVLDQPGTTEDQVVAALLHDALEDQPERTSAEEITRRFGAPVTRIVLDCTDAHTHPKPPWRHRKVAHLAHLEGVALTSLQVSLADKLHNARAIDADLAVVGPSLWTRFNAPPVAQRWYYTALAEVFRRRLDSPMSHELARTVARFCEDLPAEVALPEGVARPPWVGTDTVTGAIARLHDLGGAVGGATPVMSVVGEGAWQSTDGRWWVEAADSGIPDRPHVVFVRPGPPGS